MIKVEPQKEREGFSSAGGIRSSAGGGDGGSGGGSVSGGGGMRPESPKVGWLVDNSVLNALESLQGGMPLVDG
jgi:hypothetical protein